MLEQVLEGLSFASAMALGCSAFLTPQNTHEVINEMNGTITIYFDYKSFWVCCLLFLIQ